MLKMNQRKLKQKSLKTYLVQQTVTRYLMEKKSATYAIERTRNLHNKIIS